MAFAPVLALPRPNATLMIAAATAALEKKRSHMECLRALVMNAVYSGLLKLSGAERRSAPRTIKYVASLSSAIFACKTSTAPMIRRIGFTSNADSGQLPL